MARIPRGLKGERQRAVQSNPDICMVCREPVPVGGMMEHLARHYDVRHRRRKGKGRRGQSLLP